MRPRPFSSVQHLNNMHACIALILRSIPTTTQAMEDALRAAKDENKKLLSQKRQSEQQVESESQSKQGNLLQLQEDNAALHAQLTRLDRTIRVWVRG